MTMFKAFKALVYFESAVVSICQTLIYQIFVNVSEDAMADERSSILCQITYHTKSSQYTNFDYLPYCFDYRFSLKPSSQKPRNTSGGEQGSCTLNV